MTRDEAIKLRMMVYHGSDEFCRGEATGDVDSYAALGMLKLDEPKSAGKLYEVAADALESRGVRCNSVALEDILTRAGLEIVEK